MNTLKKTQFMASDAQKIEIPFGTKDWVNRLARREMPALAHSVQSLNSLSADDESCIQELVKVILEDPNLTARIIRISNSVHYNKTGLRTNTISRAISLIGLDTIRSMCITSKVIDALLRQVPNDRLLNVVAQSFHSAMQAKTVVSAAKNAVQEEVFIAALMYQLGEASFWCYGGDATTIVDAKLRIPGAKKDDVTEEVLGTKFKYLSFGLAKAWRLGDSLLGALQNKALTPCAGAVRLGHEISVISSNEGWESPKMAELAKKVADYKKISEEDALVQLIDCADRTVDFARSWGVTEIENLIPSSAGLRLENEEIEEETHAGSLVTELAQEDQQLQLNILRELSLMAGNKVDINMVFNMALEGIHRGIGMDRALLAMKSKDGKTVLGRYLMGDGRGEHAIGQRFNFPVKENNIFGYIFKGTTPFWFGERESAATQALLTSEIKAVLGGGEFFIAPVVVRGRSIGLVYADCRLSNRALKREQFAAFNHFIQQVNLVLSMQ